MQILQRLFKGAHEPPKEPSNKKESTSDQKVESKEIVVFNNGGKTRVRRKRVKKTRLGCSNLNPFALLCRRDVAKGCFYSTIDLKRLGNFHNMKIMNKEDSSTAHVGNKVLPISDATLSPLKNVNDQLGIVANNNEKSKGDKTKAVSKMKELLRWAASTKGDNKGGRYISRKVSQFRNKAMLKGVLPDSNDSAKISFRWEVESCSTTCSVYSAFSMASSTRKDSNVNLTSFKSTPVRNKDQSPAPKTGNWITTDSEFVVLEL